MTPAAAFMIAHWGLARAAPWLGLAMVVGVVPVTALIVRANPQAMGLMPDGAQRPSGGTTAQATASVPFAQAWRSRFFIGLTAAYIFGLGSQVGAIAHLYRLANTRENIETAALAIAVMAGTSVLGRLGAGWMLVRIPTRPFAIAMFIGQTLAMAILAFATGEIAIVAGAAFFGLTIGNVLMLQPLLLAEAFGTREYGRIYSTSQLLTAFGIAAGPFLVGLIVEAAGDYAIPYLVVAAGSLLGLAILVLAGPGNVKRS